MFNHEIIYQAKYYIPKRENTGKKRYFELLQESDLTLSGHFHFQECKEFTSNKCIVLLV